MSEKLPYKDAVEDQVKGACDPSLMNMPVGKNSMARMAQEFALARYAYNTAKGIYDDLRLTILSKRKFPLEAGDYTIVDTPQVFLAAQVTEPVRRLNEAALMEVLMDRFDMEQDEAAKLIDSCKVTGEPVVKLQVNPKR